MPDLTQAMAAKYNALRVVKKGDGLTLTLLSYKTTNKYDALHTPPLEENFNVQVTKYSRTVEGRQVGGESETLVFADVDGLMYAIANKANGCLIDGFVYKLAVSSRPRKYTSDDTDFSRVWEWFMTETGDTLVLP